MQKVWKIGTSVNSYITEWKTLTKKNWESFRAFRKPNDDYNIYLKSNDGDEIYFQKAKASQMLRTLISLGLIYSTEKSHFEKEIETCDDNEYQIIYLNDGETLSDLLSQNILNSIGRTFIDNEPIYPSEQTFIFSLLATTFSIFDKNNIKYIDRKIRGSNKVADISSDYELVSKTILGGLFKDELIKKASPYIIGMKMEVKQITDKINNNTSESKKRVEYYAPKELKNQVVANPLTFGKFVSDYFTSNNSITIPIYQRKYIWGDETVKTLLNDIMLSKDTSSHFVGNIITQSYINQGKKINKIIDGQQRITTLILILRALFDLSRAKDIEVDYRVHEKFIYTDVDSSFTHSFQRVEGNDDYDAFNYVIKGNMNKEHSTHSNIYSNYLVIINWMVDNLITIDSIKNFWNNLLNNVVMVIIDDKVSNEYKLFEKLNTGGVPLNTLELFKNFIVEKYEDERHGDEKYAQKIFEDKIIGPFTKHSKHKETDIEHFFLSSIRSNTSSVTNDTIFNQYKDFIINDYFLTQQYSFEDAINKISEEIDTYLQMSKYTLYSKSTSPFYKIADFLYMFDGRKVYYPLFLRILKVNIKDLKKPSLVEINKVREYLRIIEIFEVRMQVASYRGQSLSDLIEKVLSTFNENTTPKELWNFLNNKKGTVGMASIDEFADKLQNYKVANKAAKLIITRFENYHRLKNDENDGWQIQEDVRFIGLFDNISQREHLLPVKWEHHWKDYLKVITNYSDSKLEKEVNDTVNLIGNAFPIPDWSNNKIKNSSYESKMKTLKNSQYINDFKMISGIEGKLDSVVKNFTPEIIRKRTHQIAHISKIIWKDPY